ncbi:MAG: hypothetical protein HOP08_05575 [Cyclobacteriaceae bacterium]|nr:hypothetical protein [Cyclobacteriaceae bacterium]
MGQVYLTAFMSGQKVVFILLLIAGGARAQNSDSLTHGKFLTMVNFNRDQSYVSFGSGLGNQRPLIFEGKLSPSYFVSSRQKNWAMVMNPQVQIRMLDEKSVPIQVPSYRFYLTYYHSIKFWKNSFLSKILYEDAIWFASISHHSNGQSGSFYSNDTTKTIDLISGNFSVNFIQLGTSTFTLNPLSTDYFSLKEVKVYTEIYPSSWADTNLNKNYGFYRLFGSLGFAGPFRKEKKDWLNRWLQNSSIELKGGWIFGQYRGYDPVDIDKRFILDVSYKYYPPWFDEVAFFVRFYKGQDYYNIYYEKQLMNCTIGITSNTIKLSNAIKYLGNRKLKIQKLKTGNEGE